MAQRRREFLTAGGVAFVGSLAGCPNDGGNGGDSESNTGATENSDQGNTGDTQAADQPDFSDQQPVAAPMRFRMPSNRMYSPVAQGPQTNPTVEWESPYEDTLYRMYVNEKAIHVITDPENDTDKGIYTLSHDGEELWTIDGYFDDVFLNGTRLVTVAIADSDQNSEIYIRDAETGELTTEELGGPPDDFGARETNITLPLVQPNFESRLLVQTRRDIKTISSTEDAYFSIWNRQQGEYVQHTNSEQVKMYIFGGSGNTVYGVNSLESIYALDLETLNQTPIIENQDILSEGYRYMGFEEGVIYYYRDTDESPERVAIDAETGETIWVHSVPPAEQPSKWTMCTPGPEYIYNTSTVSGADGLVVLDRETGEIAWDHSTTVQSTTIAGDVFYAGTGDGVLLLDKHTGDEIDMIETPVPVEALVAYKDRLICLKQEYDPVTPHASVFSIAPDST